MSVPAEFLREDTGLLASPAWLGAGPSWLTQPEGPTSPFYLANPWTAQRSVASAPFGSTGMVLNSLGVPVPAPGEMTPDELRGDIESALAKLDTVNPELANELRQSQGMPTQDTDEGGLLGFLGDIGSAITGGFGKALELLGRTAHIVPAMFVHDDDPWYTDIAQAMSGHDQSSWSDVFSDWGWDGGGLSGALRAGLGFIGDVATDPLTYAFGAGGLVNTAQKGAMAAKAGFEATILARGTALGMKSADEAANVAKLLWSSMTQNTDNLGTMLKGLSPEQASVVMAGRAGFEVSEGAAHVMADAWSAASQLYERTYSRTIKNFLRRNEELVLPHGRLAGSEARGILEGYVRGGIGANPRSAAAAVATAKAAAGVMGGLRFTPFVPWTGLRYFSPTLPFTMGTLSRPLNTVARFAAGKSVFVRAERLAKNLGPTASASLSLLHQEGIQGLKNSTDPAVREMYERLAEGGVIRSAFYRASERTGGLTAAMTPGARQFRQGLGYMFAESYRKGARSTVENIIRNDLYDAIPVGTSAARAEAGAGEQRLYADWEQVWGISNRARFDTASIEDRVLAAEWLDYFGGLQGHAPLGTAQVEAGEFDDWFWNRPDVQGFLAEENLEEGGDEVARELMEERLEDMKRVLLAVPEGAKRNVLLKQSAVLTRGNDLLASYGFHSRDLGYAQLGVQRVIQYGDKAIAEAGSAPGLAGRKWYARLGGSEGATADDFVGGELPVAGITLYDRPVEGAVEVALNARSPLVVGEGGTDDAGRALTTILTNQPIIDEARAEAERGMRGTVQRLVGEGHEVLPDSVFSPARWDATLAETTSEVLRKRGGLGNDSILFRDPVQGDRLVLLGTDQVKAQDMVWTLSEHAPALQRTHGYFPRTLTRAARDDLMTTVGTTRRIMRSVPEVEARLVRKSQNKTLREAEEAMRSELVRMMEEDNVPSAVIAKWTARDANGEYVNTLLERDPLKAHEHYVRRVAGGVWAGLMGLQSERLNALGKLLPEAFGRVAHIETARTVVDTSAYAAVRRSGKQATKAVEKFIAREKLFLDGQLRDNEAQAERVAELLRRWERGEDVDLTDIEALNPQMERLVRASDDLAATVIRERERLAAEREVWTARLRDTERVEELVNVAAFREMDEYIDGKAQAIESGIPGDETTNAMGTGLQPRAAQRWTIKLNRAKVSGDAVPLGDGVWRLPDTVMGGSGEDVAGFVYLKEVDGNVVSIRSAADGSAIALTVPEFKRRGFAQSLLFAHWKDQGVTDMEGIRRMIGQNTYSDDGAALNKRVYRRYLEHLGQPTPENVERMLAEGELAIMADGSVMTRSGRYRTPGSGGARRVFTRSQVDDELRRVSTREQQLTELAQNPYRAVPRDVQAEQAGRGGLSEAEEAAAQLDNPYARLALAEGAEAPGPSRRVRRPGAEVRAEEVARARQALGAAVSREARRAERLTGELTSRQVRLRRDMTEAFDSLNDMMDTYQNAQARLRPAVEVGSHVGGHQFMQQVAVPGLQGTWWHPYMAAELEKQLLGKPISHARNMWREFVLNPWKKWATYRNPGFHIRNAMGAWFNNFLGGVGTQDYHFSFRVMSARDGGKWADKFVDGKEFREMGFNLMPGLRDLEGTLTYGNVADMLTDTGITRGSAAAVELVKGGTREPQRLRAQAARPARWADQHLRRASSSVEDYFRVAAWRTGMRSTPGDLYGARAFVMMRHGDYGDLTDTEDFIRDVVPFYKWMRTNVPYQVRMLFTNPGYLTGVAKAQSAIFEASGLSAEEYMRSTPEWMRGSLSIPIPGGKDGDPVSVLSLDLPFQDLYKGAREYVSSFLPGVFPLIESMVLKQQVYTGRELTGQMVPLAGWAQLPGVKQAVAALPFAQLGPDGQVYVPDTIENVFTGIPVYGRFRNWLTGDPNRVEKRWGALTSYFVGLPVRHIDLTDDEKVFLFDVLEPTLDAYRSMGVVFPTKDELQEAGRLMLEPTPGPDQLWPDGTVSQAA